jgi:predicted RNase H-like HicB family nuclease
LGCGIATQGGTLEELRAMVRDAVDCCFDDPAQPHFRPFPSSGFLLSTFRFA